MHITRDVPVNKESSVAPFLNSSIGQGNITKFPPSRINPPAHKRSCDTIRYHVTTQAIPVTMTTHFGPIMRKKMKSFYQYVYDIVCLLLECVNGIA